MIEQADLDQLVAMMGNVSRATLNQALRGRIPLPVRHPATVTGTARPGATATVILDGDAAALASGAVNCTNQLLTAGARVFVTLEPPQGAYVSEIITPGPWATYTPTVLQTATAVTYTASSAVARWNVKGREVTVSLFLAITGGGVLGGQFSFSVPIAARDAASNVAVGSGYYFDTSAGSVYRVGVDFATSSTLRLWSADVASAGAVGVVPNIQAGAGDTVSFTIVYEAGTA